MGAPLLFPRGMVVPRTRGICKVNIMDKSERIACELYQRLRRLSYGVQPTNYYSARIQAVLLGVILPTYNKRIEKKVDRMIRHLGV